MVVSFIGQLGGEFSRKLEAVRNDLNLIFEVGIEPQPHSGSPEERVWRFCVYRVGGRLGYNMVCNGATRFGLAIAVAIVVRRVKLVVEWVLRSG